MTPFGRPTTRVAAATLTAAMAATALIPATAGAAQSAANPDRGLFGASDPTYDGVYRQGLAITGLVAVGHRVPKASVDWVLRQQCGNGAFQAYRSDLSKRCAKSDANDFTSPDSNSTAFGAVALSATGHRREAKRATRFLLRLQNADGGFAFYRGAPSDSDSTGLALTALRSVPSSKKGPAATRAGSKFLRTATLGCSAKRADRGMLVFQITAPIANGLATAQGALGLVTGLPAERQASTRSADALKCANGKTTNRGVTRDTVLDALARRLTASKGMLTLPEAYGGGDDPAATAQAAIALAAAGRGQKAVLAARKQLRRNAKDFVATTGVGANGTLLLLSAITNSSPKRFGGVDLVQSLLDARR